jgi:hypothetical protein
LICVNRKVVSARHNCALILNVVFILRRIAIQQAGVSLRPMRRQPDTVVWVLLAAFLLQPVLTYLATPLVTHDTQGQQIVICTLQGEKSVLLDLPGPDADDGAEHCPALKLYQIASISQISEPPASPVVTLYAVEFLEQTASVAHHTLHFSAYSTRGPPAIS